MARDESSPDVTHARREAPPPTPTRSRRVRKVVLVVSLTVLGFVALGYALLPRGYLTPWLPSATGDRLPIERLVVPTGFRINVFARELEGARSMVLGRDGVVFVGTRSAGNVYALVDANRDGRSDETVVVASGLDSPNGVAVVDDTLFIAEKGRLSRIEHVSTRFRASPRLQPVTALPTADEHGWKFLAYGPDGMLYVGVGAPCNICDPRDPAFASILRMRPDGSGREVFARGIRNTVGFDWQPGSNELWFTDNGRDWLGDDSPSDELDHAPTSGLHFGFPYCHAGRVRDPEHGRGRACSDFTPPVALLGAHVAALGMRFYDGRAFPARFHGGVLVAEHGSWNRSSPSGYQVVFVPIDGARAGRPEVFVRGWLDGSRAWGRPVDVLVMPDGSVLVSDDKANAVYRISYAP